MVTRMVIRMIIHIVIRIFCPERYSASLSLYLFTSDMQAFPSVPYVDFIETCFQKISEG